MEGLVLAVLCSLAVILPATFAKNFTLEIEAFPQERESIFRTEASKNRSVPFKTGDTLRADFCLRRTTNVSVTLVRFSNDGGVDTVNIQLDGEQLGSFSSVSNSNNGLNWNVYNSSGQIGSTMELSPARHSLHFSFNTDAYGVELDFILLDVDDETLDGDLLRCMAVCDSDIMLSEVIARDNIPSGELRQASHTTFCVKDRNINYNLFHNTLVEYRVTASLPRYKTLRNDDMSENFGCEEVNDVLWEFKDFNVSPSEAQQTNNNAILTFGGSITAREITANFTLPRAAIPTRQADVDVATTLSVSFKDPVPSNSIALIHSSRDGDRTVTVPTATTANRVSWNLEALTWIPDAYNEVTFTFTLDSGSTLTVDTFKLERQAKAADENITLHQDQETIVVAVREDQTWLAGQYRGMAVRLLQNTSHVLFNITKITVFKVNRFTDGFNEVLQLGQDGEVFMKPMVPSGANSTPYGTSFIMGQYNASAPRPAALISSVIVDPFSLVFLVGYDNNNTARLEVNAIVETEIHVTNANFTKDRQKYPLAGIRSTWVSDGNSDLDHVSANQNSVRSPVDDWERLYGTAFSFFRQCVSHHHTQAPDLVLELLAGEDEDEDEDAR